MIEQHSMLVDVARREIGVHEEGHNGGKRVGEYQHAVGGGAGMPWCAAFVSWCMAQTAKTQGRPAPLCSGGAVDLYHKAHKKGLRTIKVGDPHGDVGPGWLWVRADSPEHAKAALRGQSTHGHVGIVTRVIDADHFETIEGNTNAAGSREGDAVQLKTHRFDHPMCVAFVDPYSGKA